MKITNLIIIIIILLSIIFVHSINTLNDKIDKVFGHFGVVLQGEMECVEWGLRSYVTIYCGKKTFEVPIPETEDYESYVKNVCGKYYDRQVSSYEINLNRETCLKQIYVRNLSRIIYNNGIGGY